MAKERRTVASKLGCHGRHWVWDRAGPDQVKNSPLRGIAFLRLVRLSPPNLGGAMPNKLKLCFIVGPIGAENSEIREHADWLRDNIIKPVMKQFPGFEVRRGDEDDRPGLINSQLINDLHDAELVIADLSHLNPNAFYELGIRHMVRKPVIHMQLSEQTLPFDLAHYRTIKFATHRPNIEKVHGDLKAQVDAVLAVGYEVENPVTKARERPTAVTPEAKALSQDYLAIVMATQLPFVGSRTSTGTRELFYRYCIRF